MTPLLAASVTGHLPIVEHLITLFSVSREDRIAALELLGATYVDKKRDMLSALSFWRRAMEDRYGQEPKIPKLLDGPTHAAYDYVQEVNDFNALDELVMDPDEMRMQALVIRERILGPAHPDTSYYIRYRGAVYADAGRFDRCIELWTYALTMQQEILEPLSPMTQSSLLSFAELFSFMLGEAGRPVTRGRIVPPIDSNDMLLVFDKSLQEVKQGQKMLLKFPEHDRDTNALSRALVSALHLACLLARLLVTTKTVGTRNGAPIVEERVDLECMAGLRAEEMSKEELEVKRRVLKALHELVSLKVSCNVYYVRLTWILLSFRKIRFGFLAKFNCFLKKIKKINLMGILSLPGCTPLGKNGAPFGLLPRRGTSRPISCLPISIAAFSYDIVESGRRSECNR